MTTVDLWTVSEVCAAQDRGPWRTGDAWLAGGTYLFAEPQPGVRRLVDLMALGWSPVCPRPDGSVEIAATCTIAELSRFAAGSGLPVAGLVEQCCRALQASTKIWHTATVGGNLCLGLPAGSMISLAAALDGVCQVVGTDGVPRAVPAADFVTGPGRTVLASGELLRSVTLPARSLSATTSFRQVSLHPHGRSAVLVTGARDGAVVALTITASTTRPVRLTFGQPPVVARLRTAIDAAVGPNWLDDQHGQRAWRRHLTMRLATEALAELAGSA